MPCSRTQLRSPSTTPRRDRHIVGVGHSEAVNAPPDTAVPPLVAEALRAIVDDARRAVSSGSTLDVDALRGRVHAAAGDDPAAQAAAQRTLAQLDRVAAVHRARATVAKPLTPPERPIDPAPAGAAVGRLGGLPRPGALRTRPTITANMDVKREGTATSAALTWTSLPGVANWEIRLSARPDPRGDYEVFESRTAEPSTTRLELTLSDRPLRVNLLGHRRDGKLLQRALISGLTAENWSDRWEKRASAS